MSDKRTCTNCKHFAEMHSLRKKKIVPFCIKHVGYLEGAYATNCPDCWTDPSSAKLKGAAK